LVVTIEGTILFEGLQIRQNFCSSYRLGLSKLLTSRQQGNVIEVVHTRVIHGEFNLLDLGLINAGEGDEVHAHQCPLVQASLKVGAYAFVIGVAFHTCTGGID